MDQEDKACEPQTYYRSIYLDSELLNSLTQVEKEILRDLLSLRGNEDKIRHIQILIHHEASKVRKDRSMSRKEALNHLTSIGGMLQGTDTSVSYHDPVDSAIATKFTLPDAAPRRGAS